MPPSSQPTPRSAGTPPAIRRRTLLVVGSIATVAVLLPIGLLVILFSEIESPAPPPIRDMGPVVPPAPLVPGAAEWNLAAQTALATRPMLRLPEGAAWPHPFAERTAGPPIVLPHPIGRTPRPAGSSDPAAVPTEPVDPVRTLPVAFPATAEGAVAQLAALTQVGLEGGDPQVYRHAYESIMLPGAPAVDSARLYRDLRRVRSGVLGFPPTGAVAGLVFTWTPTSALVKGTTDGGRYVVVCVLGELVTGIHGQSISTGAGDCQALRRAGDRWRISPGVAAAPATLAWPGSANAVRAGYRAVRR